jgi:hypothetical protein
MTGRGIKFTGIFGNGMNGRGMKSNLGRANRSFRLSFGAWEICRPNFENSSIVSSDLNQKKAAENAENAENTETTEETESGE